MTKKLFYLLVILLGLVAIYLAIYSLSLRIDVPQQRVTITNFEECGDAGNPIMESYPRRCRADGVIFTENVGNAIEKMELIRLALPKPNESIASPVELIGEARGYWFFEASFPIEVRDANRNILGIGIAEAQDEWMTEFFVPFKANISFSSAQTTTGTLILKKDNPSGLPEYEDSLIIPIKFKNTGTSGVRIKNDFGSKIVYELDGGRNIEGYKDDCIRRSGVFNPCGSPCGPETDMCIQVCTYTCEFK